MLLLLPQSLPPKSRPTPLKRLPLVLLLVSANIMGCVASTPRGFYKRGTDAIAKGDFKQGIVGLTRAIESQPNFPEAYVNRGIAYAELGELENAIADYEKAIELNPDLIDAHYNLGNLFLQQEKPSEAIAAYSDALALDTTFAYALGNRASAFEKIGDTEKAIADLRQAIQLFNEQGQVQAALKAQKKLNKLQSSKTP